MTTNQGGYQPSTRPAERRAFFDLLRRVEQLEEGGGGGGGGTPTGDYISVNPSSAFTGPTLSLQNSFFRYAVVPGGMWVNFYLEMSADATGSGQLSMPIPGGYTVPYMSASYNGEYFDASVVKLFLLGGFIRPTPSNRVDFVYKSSIDSISQIGVSSLRVNDQLYGQFFIPEATAP